MEDATSLNALLILAPCVQSMFSKQDAIVALGLGQDSLFRIIAVLSSFYIIVFFCTGLSLGFQR